VNGAGRPRRRFKSPGLSPGAGAAYSRARGCAGVHEYREYGAFTGRARRTPQNTAETRGFTAGLKSRGGGFGPMRRKGVGETRGRGGRFKRQRGAAYSRRRIQGRIQEAGGGGCLFKAFIQEPYSRATARGHVRACGCAGALSVQRAAGFTVSFKSYGVAAKGQKRVHAFIHELRC